MSKRGSPKSFIEYELPLQDLKEVQGGRRKVTTLAVGEECGGPITTLAVGEEGGGGGPILTTLALGEEGGGG